MGFSRPALHLVLITLPVSRYLVCDAHHIRKVGGAAGTKSVPLPTATTPGWWCRPLRSMRKALRASVTFEPGARTAWHMHPLGQTLIVTAGCGWVQLSALNGVRTFATTEVGV